MTCSMKVPSNLWFINGCSHISLQRYLTCFFIIYFFFFVVNGFCKFCCNLRHFSFWLLIVLVFILVLVAFYFYKSKNNVHKETTRIFYSSCCYSYFYWLFIIREQRGLLRFRSFLLLRLLYLHMQRNHLLSILTNHLLVHLLHASLLLWLQKGL